MTIAIPRLDRTTAADRGLTLADFLVPIPVGERLNARVRHILLIAAGALFIYLTARLAIPRDPVPWTGQTFGILVVGGALGARRGFAAVALYVLLGLIGLPFFAEGKGGTAVLLGPIGRLPHRLRARRRRSSAGWPSSAGTASIGGALGDDAHRHGRDLRDRAAVAELQPAPDDGRHDRQRSDAVHRLGRRQAARRGRDLPRRRGGSSGGGRTTARPSGLDGRPRLAFLFLDR